MKLSLIVPTYNEKDNIVALVQEITSVCKRNKIEAEIIIVDDGSPDGTGEIVQKLQKKNKNIRLLQRGGKLGLSSAVLDGIKMSRGDVVGVMDADLSHPIAKLPELFSKIRQGNDFVIGSRYIAGGNIVGWGLKRKILSRGATVLAKPFTRAKDPMSGFFMIKKKCLEGRKFNARGFKICLEFLVKANYSKLAEVPIVFTDRKLGKSKAGTKEIIYLLTNLFGYAMLKKYAFYQFILFGIIGLLGTVVNLTIYYLLTRPLSTHYLIAASVSFFCAMTFNYILNKVITFKEKINDGFLRKYGKYFFVSLIGWAINMIVLLMLVEFLGVWDILSQAIAIAIAMMFNFLGNKLWTFRRA